MAIQQKKETSESETITTSQITYRLPKVGETKKSQKIGTTPTVAETKNSPLRHELFKTVWVSLLILGVLGFIYTQLR